MIIEKAYAKINLSLDVLGEREDGYHELRSVMTPISLCDELYFSLSNDIEVESETDIKDNIILKTANLMKEMFHVNEGALIKLVKRIPISAGLAGGSADCSATIRGLNKLWKLNKSLDELKEVASLLGSDTVFCLYNKLAYVLGRGEDIHFIQSNIDSYVLIIKPYFPVSTKEVFTHHVSNPNSIDRFHPLLDELMKDEKLSLYNDLMETTLSLYPALATLMEEVRKEDSGVMMSGSGPTLYVLSKDRIHLNQLYRMFIPRNIVYLAKIGIFM